MRHILKFASHAIALCLLISMPANARPQHDPPAVPPADSAAITQLCADFSVAFSRHDARAVAETFSEDADFTNMRGNHSRGRAEIEKWFAGLFRANLKDAVRTDTVRSVRLFSPELAAIDADSVIHGTKAPDGSELPARNGLMVLLAIKQSGRWRIATFHEEEYPPARTAPEKN